MHERGSAPARSAFAGGAAAVVFAAAAAFALGMTLLFQDRMEAGDIYPAYSTLRSDPKGCRAFFTALGRYPDLDVRRAYASGDFRGQKPGAAYFFLGLEAESFRFQGESLKELDSLARGGQRVILAFAPLVHEEGDTYVLKRAGLWPVDSASAKDSAALAERKARAERDSAAKARQRLHGKPAPDAEVYMRIWGFNLLVDTVFDAEKRYVAFPEGNRKDTLPWLSALYFDSLQGPWKILYRRGRAPVAAERPLGAGSIVLVSDSYFASNEAQLQSRPARLAARLLGSCDRAFFDERHLGVRQDDAVANLLRRYRLHWILPSLLLLLALYVWKNRTALLPDPTGVPETAPEVSQPTSGSALGGLLRRNLTDRQALEACYTLWKEGETRLAAGPASTEDPRAQARRELESELSAALEKVKPSGSASLASAYGGIQAILKGRKRK
jgi:hypothetical protein